MGFPILLLLRCACRVHLHIKNTFPLTEYSDLTVSSISQRSSVYYTGPWQLLQYLLTNMYGNVEVVVSDSSDAMSLRVFDAITIVFEPPVVVLEVLYVLVQSSRNINLC